MFSRKHLLTATVLILGLLTVASAQQPQLQEPGGRPPDQKDGRDPFGRGRHDRMGRQRGDEFRVMRELNLTEEQTQQQKAIIQRHLESIKSQREELSNLREKRMQGTLSAADETRAQALRQEIDNARQSMQSEVEAILTAEQRTKLEQIKSERRTRNYEMRKRHREPDNNLP